MQRNCKDICTSAKALLLDIEGTTTPITFVTETLFPYARANLEEFLRTHWHIDQIASVLAKLKAQAKSDISDGVKDVPAIEESTEDVESVLLSVIANVRWQMSLNRKTTGLKELQGMIWRNAYESGEIKGALYEDVQPALEQLKKSGKMILIYSSGSVAAQKLLFGYSDNGNMLPLIDGHFDTLIGDKKSKESYSKIAEKVNLKPSEMLFLTDVDAEADAAMNADMEAFIVSRPGNKPIEQLHRYTVIKNFAEML